MRDVIVYMSMSLDGFVASDREHPRDRDPRGRRAGAVEARRHQQGRCPPHGPRHLAGSSYWPQSQDPYAGPMNDIPKVVFSTTLGDAEATWPATRVAPGDLATEISTIKAEPGPDVIVWGGSRVAGALAAADLVDEYRLLVQPLVVGRGQALFDQLPDSRHLELIEARPFPSGILAQVYRPKHT